MIESINYNWYTSEKNGEEFTNRTVGCMYDGNMCIKIEEYLSRAYDIHYSDGSKSRVFNPNEVLFAKD